MSQPQATQDAAAREDRLLIVESVTRKRAARGPAKEVYDSRLWTARRCHAEQRGLPWLILSARHGLLDPDQPIDPYELPLGELGNTAFAEVAAGAVDRLAARGWLRGRVIEAHVREEVGDPLEAAIAAHGGRVEQPVRGLSVCGQLQWYRGEVPAAGHACTLADAA